MTIQELSDLYNSYFVEKDVTSGINIPSGLNVTDNVIDSMKVVCKEIVINDDISEIDLEYKIILSIVTRILCEEMMIRELDNQGLSSKVAIIQSEKNQFIKLARLYRGTFKNTDSKMKLINKVRMLSSENIHVNSFMYEPLIDMGIQHLKNLYKEQETASSQE